MAATFPQNLIDELSAAGTAMQNATAAQQAAMAQAAQAVSDVQTWLNAQAQPQAAAATPPASS